MQTKNPAEPTQSISRPLWRQPALWILAATITISGAIIFISPALMATPSQQTITPEIQGFKPLAPEPAQIRTSMRILDQLNYNHYQELAVDDQLSSTIFDHYFDLLDISKSYLISSDIQEFNKFRYQLDDALKNGNLFPSFAIFNRYQQRTIERLQYVLKLITKEMDQWQFNQNESLETDRKKAQWAKNIDELNQLWKKRIKAAELNLILANKTPKEAKQILLKRYQAKLHRSLQINSEDVFQAYMNAVTQTYDPHTQYLSPSNSENFNINMSLSLEGIGAVLQTEDEYTKIVSLVPAGPAEKSGLLHPADRIVGVSKGNGKEMVDVIGWRIDEVVELIRGAKGSVVRLEIIPSTAENTQETKIVSITRDTVKLEEQAAQKKIIPITQNGKILKIGVISLPTFYIDYKAMHDEDPNYRSSTRDVARLLQVLKKENVDGLVLDLRDNGGGYLQEANHLVGLFIKTGPTVQIRDDHGQVELLADTDPNIAYTGPMVVLVNRLSASASEIFAGAIQDYKRGLIIGSQTFGKGTVQALRDLDRGQLKITESKFYRISGDSNQHLGIIPDITLPSIYDKDQIGESALDNALPWDRIQPVKYALFNNNKPNTNLLIAQHNQRVAHDPDFEYLLSYLALSKENAQKTKLSLNQKQRIEERQQNEAKLLALENSRRTALNLPLLKHLKAESDPDSESLTLSVPPSSKEKDKDTLLDETAHIVADMTLMMKNTHSEIPATIRSK